MIEHTMQKTVQIQNQATADIDDRATPTIGDGCPSVHWIAEFGEFVSPRVKQD